MFEHNLRTGRYRTTSSREGKIAGCLAILLIVAINLMLPGAVVSILGNIAFPQLNFTLLGGMATVFILRVIFK